MHRIRQLVLLAALSAAALSVTAVPATAADRDRSVGAVYTLTNSPSRQRRSGLRPRVRRFAHAARDCADRRDWERRRPRVTRRARSRRPTPVRSQRGNNTISALRVGQGNDVFLTDVARSRHRPISLTVRGHLLYVLNAGNDHPANIHGFLVLFGQLIPLPGSSRPLSTASPGQAPDRVHA